MPSVHTMLPLRICQCHTMCYVCYQTLSTGPRTHIVLLKGPRRHHRQLLPCSKPSHSLIPGAITHRDHNVCYNRLYVLPNPVHAPAHVPQQDQHQQLLDITTDSCDCIAGHSIASYRVSLIPCSLGSTAMCCVYCRTPECSLTHAQCRTES